MILSDIETDDRLGSPDNLVNQLASYPSKSSIVSTVEIRTIPHGGRTEGALEVGPNLRQLIGSTYNEGDETQAEVAEAFGVSQPVVGQAAKGLIGNRYDSSLATGVKAAEAKINEAHDLALDALVSSLGALTSDAKKAEIGDLSAPKLARLASDLSKITSNLKPADSADQSVKVQVVLFAPNRMRTEKEYETVNA